MLWAKSAVKFGQDGYWTFLFQKIYLKVFLCQYYCHIYCMLILMKSEKKKLYLASCISPNKQWSQYLVHVCKIRLSRESFLFFENLVFSNCCGRGDFKGQKMTKMIKHVYICSHKHPTTYPMIICVTHFVEWGFKFIFEKCVSLLARRLGEKARKW